MIKLRKLVTEAMGLKSYIQKHEGEACDSDYPFMAFHAVVEDRKWWRWMEEMRPPEEKWMAFAAKAKL